MFLNESFFIFFSLVLLLHSTIPERFRWSILLIASYLFYAYIDLRFPIYLFIVTLFAFFIGSGIDKYKNKRKLLLTLGIVFPVAILFYFKYLNFFLNTIGEIAGIHLLNYPKGGFRIILPIGISFYVFKIISYHIDHYNGRINHEKHFGYFSLYLAFFPQLLAGPIERGKTFIPQLHKEKIFDKHLFLSGLKLVLWGIIKKTVVADRLAMFVNEVFPSPVEYKGITLIAVAIFFSFQIYCDFSGYSDIAIGLGRILGYETKDNFNYPYFSRNISEFWNNWHISLSSWLRDYIFYPTAFSTIRKLDKIKILKSNVESLTYIIASILTMFIAGLWHGANWTFIVWGLLIAFFLIISFLTKKIRKKFVKLIKINRLKRVHNIFRILLTFIMVTFAWIFFRAPTIKDAFIYLKNISFSFTLKSPGQLFFMAIILLLFILGEILIRNNNKLLFIDKIHWSIKLAGYCILLSIIIILGVDTNNEFLYFRF